MLATSPQFALGLGAGAFAGAVLHPGGAVLAVCGAAALADEDAVALLVGAVVDGRAFGEVVVQLQERHGVDGGVAVGEITDADAEAPQSPVQHLLQ